MTGVQPTATPAAPVRTARRPVRRHGDPTLVGPAGTIVAGILLALTAAVFLVPLLWLVGAAFKPNDEIYQWPISWLPSRITLSNFVYAWQSAPLGRFFANSVILVAVGTVVKVVLAVLSAYAFAFLDFPGKRFVFLVVLGVLMVPGNVTLLINYVTISNLGLVNTYAGILLPGLGSAFGTFLLRQHFLGLDRAVFEAAELDGAGTLRKLIGFAVPLARPAVITVALLGAIDEWNSYIWPLIVTNSDDMRTVSLGLQYLQVQDGLQRWGPIMAGTLLTMVPVLLLYLFAQRSITSGMVGAAVR